MTNANPSVHVGRGYFSRIELRPDRGAAYTLGLLSEDGYRLHQSLWRLFKADGVGERDFLYRATGMDGRSGCYVVSARPPQDTDRVWRIRTKDYAPTLVEGERLAFSLRANPVVTRRERPGAKPVRHDVVTDARKRGVLDETAAEGPYYRPGLEWLTARSERHGFRVEQVGIDGFRRHRLGEKKGKGIVIRTLDFDGILTVTDPDRLLQTLFAGIGPAKAFGCGLLLVRRV